MQDSKPRNNNRKVAERQDPIWTAAAPRVVSELLTLREVKARWPALRHERIYAWVRDGQLHAVRPQGRVLYPEWELSELVKRLYRSGSELGTRAA